MVTIKNSGNEEVSLPHKQIILLGKEINIYREVSSTNHIAQSMARSGALDGTLVMSMTQTAGRGRMKRQWSCPPSKGILMSMILRPELSVQFVPQLTLLCGVVVAETLRKVTGCSAGIKWPNDIVINGKKVCGILAQSSYSSSDSSYVIMGVGINVNQNIHQLPPDCLETSTSLRLELGHKVSRFKVLEQFMVTWEEHYQCFLTGGHQYLRTKWIENNVTLGRNVTINQEIAAVQGVAIDISERGGLIVSFPDGSAEEYLAGDLSLGKTHYGQSLVDI